MTVKIGIVGLGRLGKIHAENLVKKVYGGELVAATSLDEKELTWAKENLGIKHLYSKYNDMLDNPDIDAVFIVSPSGFHPEQIEKALLKNKHVFCEKPIGLNIEDIQRIIPIVNSSDKKFMLGFMRRFDESYRYAKEKIDSGDIGDITLVRSYSIDPSSGMPSFLNFARNSNSGGIFLDMAIHDIDVIRWLLNSDEVGIEKVWALGNNIAYPELTDLNEVETGAAMLQMKNNTIGFLVAGRNAAHGYHVETEIIGTKGMLRIATVPEKNLVTVMNESGIVRPTSQNFPERFEQAYLSEAQHFINAIRDDLDMSGYAESGLYATQIALALQDSYKNNELVNLGGN